MLSAKSSSAGFTLIEIMIAVTIIGILAAIAIPQYRDYVLRGQLQQLTARLSEFKLRLEQRYADNRDYSGSLCPATLSSASETNYTIACVLSGLASQGFLLTGTGQGPLNGFSYTIDQAGTKNTTGQGSNWGGAVNGTWVDKKGG